jgi:hypothetical protein
MYILLTVSKWRTAGWTVLLLDITFRHALGFRPGVAQRVPGI